MKATSCTKFRRAPAKTLSSARLRDEFQARRAPEASSLAPDFGSIHECEPGMRVFHCNHCDHLLFFENTECVSCHHRVAYLPDLAVIGSLEEDADGHWRSPLNSSSGRAYRLCRNYPEEQVCNWAVVADELNPLCASCR